MPTIKEVLNKLDPATPEEGKCRVCGEAFSEANTYTAAGWRETKISQTCESCFDDLLAEDGEDRVQ